jgi:hypothetical protein
MKFSAVFKAREQGRAKRCCSIFEQAQYRRDIFSASRGWSLSLLRQLICANLQANDGGRSRAVQLPGRNGSGRMPGRTRKSGFEERDGIEIAVDASQQIDQLFPFFLPQTGEQATFALKRDGNDKIVGRTSFGRQGDRVASPVELIGFDGDQSPGLHDAQCPADGTLVVTNDVTDTRGGNCRLDREQRQNSPLRDIYAKALLVEDGGAAGQLVRDKGNKGRNIAVEIEQRSIADICDFRGLRPAWLSGGRTAAHIPDHRCGAQPRNRDMGHSFTRPNFGRSP